MAACTPTRSWSAARKPATQRRLAAAFTNGFGANGRPGGRLDNSNPLLSGGPPKPPQATVRCVAAAEAPGSVRSPMLGHDETVMSVQPEAAAGRMVAPLIVE